MTFNWLSPCRGRTDWIYTHLATLPTQSAVDDGIRSCFVLMTKLTTCSANVTGAAAAHFLPGNTASSPERSWMQVQVPVPQITARRIKVRRIKVRRVKVRRIKAVNHLREVKHQSHRM